MSNRPFEYGVQRPDGTYQVISEQNPVPVTIRGLPTLQDEICSTINNASAQQLKWIGWLGENASSEARGHNVELWWASWAICGQIEMTRKAIIWCAAGLGALYAIGEVLCHFIH